MKNLINKAFLIILLSVLFLLPTSAQDETVHDSIYMDFRNQKISDIIYSIAEICGENVFVDETVTGNATFRFEDSSFENALNRFASYCQLYVSKSDSMFVVSKVQIKIENGITINTENVLVEPFLNMLSRETQTTIMYDALPNATVTLRLQNSSIEDILNLVVVKLTGFAVERIASGYYLTRSSVNASRKNIDVFTISNVEESYSISLQKADFGSVIEVLFKKANKEYSLLSKNNIQLENLKYDNKDFDFLLRLLLEQANCDYSVQNNVYYIFDIQRKDVLKKFKDTKIIHLNNFNVENISAMLPQELSSNMFMKLDKENNNIILTGSNDELKPIENFLSQIDTKITDREFVRYDLKNIPVKEIQSLIPASFLCTNFIEIPNSNSFIIQIETSKVKDLNDFLKIIDNKNKNCAVKLKYIKSSDLVANLPPSVSKENIIETKDTSLVFFTGNSEQYDDFIKELEFIDKPAQQVKYQILVIQRQKTDNLNWSSVFNMNNTDSPVGIKHSEMLANIFNINFDIITQFGLQFAESLNAELGTGKSRVLADTTLNGISGETITFSNTNTFRYRDIIVDTSGDLYTSTTREIASGLVLNINGWVSGDDMVTVKVDAQVSKQGTSTSSSSSSDTTNPPSTSEKKVSTNVRTKSGEMVTIGGLIQQEDDLNEKKVPGVGSIPALGELFKSKNVSSVDSEFIIYLIPFVEKENLRLLSETENLERLIKKYDKKL